jgi:hypothetical protein
MPYLERITAKKDVRKDFSVLKAAIFSFAIVFAIVSETAREKSRRRGGKNVI